MAGILISIRGYMSRLILFLIIFSLSSCVPQLVHKNTGVSSSVGEVNNGHIKNAYLLPRKGENFKSFSRFSYYTLGRAYVHSAVHKIILDAYQEMAEKYPDYEFRYGECSRRKGGKMLPHRTHQNGTSCDFLTPLLKKEKKQKLYDGLGIFRALQNFTDEGVYRSAKKVKIDFNMVAEHILVLEKHARKNGMRIKKVIFKIELKDELFASEKGKLLKKKNIYFAQKLPKLINNLHDDHYHVDFELL